MGFIQGRETYMEYTRKTRRAIKSLINTKPYVRTKNTKSITIEGLKHDEVHSLYASLVF